MIPCGQWKAGRGLTSWLFGVKKYQGKNKAELVDSLLNMYRLAVAVLDKDGVHKSVELVQESLELIKTEPELQDSNCSAVWNLTDMANMNFGTLRDAEDPRAGQFRDEVKRFTDQLANNTDNDRP